MKKNDSKLKNKDNASFIKRKKLSFNTCDTTSSIMQYLRNVMEVKQQNIRAFNTVELIYLVDLLYENGKIINSLKLCK